MEENSLPKNDHSLLMPGAILAAGVIIALAIVYAFGGRPEAGYLPPDQPRDYADDDASLGSPDAPVVIVEFSDYQCPFCRRYWRQVLPRLKEEYIKTGDVRFIYRDFPLSHIHPAAEMSARATECAEEQGKFWQMHDKIFEEQDRRAVRDDKLDTVEYSEADLKIWARDIGVDPSPFDACLGEYRYQDEIAKDLSDGQVAGVEGTPGTFINDRYISGSVPYEQIRAAIEAELAEKRD
jgi:protein-disulfide isomerase